MATATAPAPTPRVSKTPSVEFPALRIHQWQTNPKHPARRWVSLTIPFSEAVELFQAREYDFAKDSGEQRPLTKSWISQLRKRMETDEYVPAPWSACLRPSHDKRAEWHENGTVTLKIDPKDPISLIDGNHRKHGVIKLYEFAQKRGDVATMELINQCDITVLIYLEPKRSRENFQALQEGRKVSGDLLEVQKKRKDPLFVLAWSLHNNDKSHLNSRISFNGQATNMLGFKTAITKTASELSCSLRGVMHIAKAFGHDGKWAEACYVEAWDAVKNATEKTDVVGVQMASVLLSDKYLCPLGYDKGKKGGTTLINGVCNMWAYLKAVKKLKDMPESERIYLANTVDEVFDFPKSGGLDAPKKRTLMGSFARAYFASIVLEDGEKPKAGKVAASDGIPIQLTNDLMTPSAFGPPRSSDDVDEGEGEDEEEWDVEDSEEV
jgi:hypothetical protein